MKLADSSIRHPVFITMAVLAIIVLGLVSYSRLPVEFFPDISLPIVAVTTPYPGAAPEDVESQVSKPIEEALSVLKGVRKVRSTSTEGVSIVIVEFELEMSAKEMAAEVREKVSNIRRTLPNDILEPQYEKFDPSDQPIITYSFVSPKTNLSPSQIRYLIENKIKPFLERIDGVAAVTMTGGEEREIEIAVRRSDLELYEITMPDVIRTLKAANIEMPGGRFTSNTQELLLKTNAKILDPDELRNLIIKEVNGFPVRVRDLATVRDGYKETRQLSRTNNTPSVTIDIRKQSGTNTVTVAQRIHQEMERLAEEYPQIQPVLASDDSIFVKASRDEMVLALLEGIVLASLVVLLFFRDIRGTLITVAGLPICVIGTFIFLLLFGYTINLITLLALSLSIGLLIDDAIVVRENIFRWMEKGKSPFEAAREATSEVALAVLATTMTVVAVFLPIAFTQGMAGKFFRQFGVTISVAVIISLLEAFTLAPMLSAFFFKKSISKMKEKKSRIELFISGLDSEYRKLLEWSLNHRWWIIGIATVTMIGTIFIIPLVGIGGDSKGDRGMYSVVVEAPQGISLSEMNRRVVEVEDIVKKHPRTKDYFTTIGTSDGSSNQAAIMVKIDQLVTKKVMNDIRPLLKAVPGVQVSVEEVSGVRNKSATIQQRPIQLNIQGPETKVLQQISSDFQTRMREVSGLVDVDNSLRSGKPEFQYTVKREVLAKYGVTASEVAAVVRSMVNGETATKYRDGDDEIEVNVRLRPEDRTDPSQLLSIRYPLKNGTSIPLSEIVALRETVGPAQINRQDRTRQVVIAANITPERGLGDVADDIKAKLSDYRLPSGYTLKYEGQVSQNKESFTNLFLALFLAILFVYMVLASQFNSYLHPFTIMLALPLAVIGGFIGLLFTGRNFDMIAFIGLILLMGIVTKNSILLVDFANQLRTKGATVREALLEAGPVRLRPILMTTLAMIGGMIPTALGLGSAASFRVSLGVVVIGGIVSSTVLTLVVIPVAYEMFEGIKRWMGFHDSFTEESRKKQWEVISK
ncbi:MAG: efflux RND transporter permease subunit [bacterium]|nr:efflux RND transporter permease subunit [bacterium]